VVVTAVTGVEHDAVEAIDAAGEFVCTRSGHGERDGGE